MKGLRRYFLLISLSVLLLVLWGSPQVSHAQVVTGKCGDAATWSYDSKKKLLQISGSGTVDCVIKMSKDYVNEYGNKKRYAVKKIQFPNSLKAASYNTFRNCVRLNQISIGASYAGGINPDTVGATKGLNLSKLPVKKIVVSAANKHYRVKGNILYSHDGKTLYQVLRGYDASKIMIRKKVKKIAREAFLQNYTIKK